MNPQGIYIILGWLILNFFLVCIRMIWSEEKIGRIKSYFQGVVFLLVFYLIFWTVLRVPDQQWFVNLYEKVKDFHPIIEGIIVLSFSVIWILGILLALSMILVHVAKTLLSWYGSDFEIWSENQ